VEDIADDNKDEKDDSRYISYTRGLIIAIAPFCVLVLVIYICTCFSFRGQYVYYYYLHISTMIVVAYVHRRMFDLHKNISWKDRSHFVYQI
jgi:hypothetical protein